MKILIVTQYFWPEEFRINEMSRMLVQRGHQVTVLTGLPNYPAGRFFPGYGLRQNRRQNYEGVEVVRVPLIPRGKSSPLRLALNYFSFAFMAALLGPSKCPGRYDVIFVYEPSPITVGLPAICLKKKKSAPLIFWVQDLWPESLSAIGAVRAKFILNRVGSLVRYIYHRCDLILVQSKVFIEAIAELSIPTGKIKYFPNSAEEIFDGKGGPNGNVDRLTFPDGFRLMFAGNIGAAQDFETILKAAELTKEREDIHWIIVGDGHLSPWVKAQVQSRGLQNTFHLMGRHPLEDMPAFFARADAMLVTLKKDPIFALTIPGKVQSYLACSRPIIAALDGEGARIIEEAGAGLTCPAEDPEVLAKTILKVYHMPREEREKMARLGRDYFEKNFERQLLLNRLEGWFLKLSRNEEPCV